MANRLKLTTTAVDRLTEPGIYWDTQTPGLGVRVSDSGMRTYFYKRRVKGSGKERNVSLGRQSDPVMLPDGSLRTYPFGAEDARTKAAAVQAQMLAGIDPVQKQKDDEAAAAIQQEQQKALGTTLQQVIDHYLEHHRVKGRPLRPKTKKDYRTFMVRHFKSWLPQPVVSITRTMCDDRVREIEKGSPIQAHKARVYLRLFLNSAKTDAGEPLLPVNPVTRMVTKTHPPKARKRRIPAAKLGAVYSMLRQRSANPRRELDRTAADWVSTLILTGWRAFECAALEWSWIDWTAKTIKLPGDVEVEDERGFSGVKTHAEITLPMSDVLHSILITRFELDSRDARYVFPAKGDGDLPHITKADGTFRAVSQIAGYHITPHDCRRSFLSVAKACRVDYVDRMYFVNHSSKTVHEDYEREDDPEVLRGAANLIGNHIMSAAKLAEAQASGANVVSLADRRATLGNQS
ncbi:MAG: tyrosine-type recombinase/integrase [Steroidobacteraceae bacterium]